MKKNLKKLLLVAVCLHTVTGILNATENNPRSTPNTTKYLEYKTAVHNTCSEITFEDYTVDRLSNIYATILSKNNSLLSIYKINNVGICKKLTTLSKTKYAPFSHLLAVDTKRNFIYTLYVSKRGTIKHTLLKFNFSGKLIKSTVMPSTPTDYSSIAIDTNGNVYILDKTKGLIHKFSTSGNLLLTWGGIGTYDGKFKEPISLAIDKYNKIYVVDSKNYRIQKFDSTGNFITKWGTHASNQDDNHGIYEFWFMGFVGVDNDLNVYVSDGLTVKKFHSDGDYIATIRSKNNLGFNFIPTYNATKVDGLGNIYTNKVEGILKYNKNLYLIDGWGRGHFGRGEHIRMIDMVFDSQNNMYTLDRHKCYVQKFSKTGKYIRQWGENGIGIGQFNCGNANLNMAINSFDEIYILDSHSIHGDSFVSHHKIHRYNKDGKLLQTISLPKEMSIDSIATDKYNRLYISAIIKLNSDKYGSIIHVYDRYGKKLKEIKFPTESHYRIHNMEIDIDKKRNILYIKVNAYNSNISQYTKVLKCTLSGKILTGWEVPSYNRGQIVLKNGNLGYVKDKTLGVYSNSGVFVRNEVLATNIYSSREDNFGNIYIGSFTKIYKKSVNPDIDHDGVINEKDAFPFNRYEWLDTDHDGIGNNADKDDDNDGLSDALEKAHKLNPLNASDAQADFDHDGFSNAIEINAGTNIRSAKSRPIWTPVVMGDMIMFIPAKK